MKKRCLIAFLLCILLTSCQPAAPQPGETGTPPPSPISESPPSMISENTTPSPPEDPPPTPTGEFYTPDLLIEEDYWQQDYWTDGGVLLLRVSVARPKLSRDYPAALRVAFNELSDADKQEAERLQTVAQVAYDSDPERFAAYAWEKNYTVERNDGVYLSIFYDNIQCTGGAHGDEYVQCVAFRVADARQVGPGELFTIDAFASAERLSALIYEQIAPNAEEYYADVKQLIRQEFSFDACCLTDTGLAVFYQPYQLGPYTLGVLRFDIPFEAYEDIWKG